MEDTPQRMREVGARRKRLRAELFAADHELRTMMPTAKALMTQEEIRSATGLSIPTIRTWTAR
jgi:hypothetical protein